MGEGYIFDAKTAKPLGKVDGIGTTVSMPTEHKFDALNVTVADPKPKFETVRELRIDYSEGSGDAYRTLTIETFATAKELRKLLMDLRKDVTK